MPFIFYGKLGNHEAYGRDDGDELRAKQMTRVGSQRWHRTRTNGIT